MDGIHLVKQAVADPIREISPVYQMDEERIAQLEVLCGELFNVVCYAVRSAEAIQQKALDSGVPKETCDAIFATAMEEMKNGVFRNTIANRLNIQLVPEANQWRN